MEQLSIFDFMSETEDVLNKVFSIIKEYLVNHGNNNEYFIYKFKNYSQLLNKGTKIAVSMMSNHATDMYLWNGDIIHYIRIFKDNCIIEDREIDSHNYRVLYEVMFQNYDELRQVNHMKNFLEWYKGMK